MTKKYKDNIIPFPTKEDIQVKEDSENTLRYSLDGTKAVVKFNGDTPSFLIGEPQYDHGEILNILSGAEWVSDEL
jgi:hypothetical protein